MKYIRGRVSYLKEDMNLAKSIMKKKFDDYEKLKTLLAKNLGYIGKFTEFLMNENIPLVELETLYRELLTLKEKQLPVNINGLKYEQVLDTVQKSKESLLINSLVSQFPSEQKKFAKEMMSNDKKVMNTNIILKVAQKEDTSAFISKVSRYKTIEELKTALTIFSKDPINDRDKVSSVLKELKSEIITNTDKVVIVRVDNYDDIVKLGSDTSWCIVKSSSTYDSYAKGRYQFIIYNYNLDEYDPKFKIGFTLTREGGVYAAHDVLDNGAKSELSNLLVSIDVKTTDLIPKREPVVFDINKLNSKTTGDRFKEIADECQLELIPQLIKIILNSNKNDVTKTTVIRKCFVRLLGARPWILASELDKISTSIHRYIAGSRYAPYVVDEDEVDGRLNEEAFSKGLSIWTKEQYADIHFSMVRDIEKNISKPTLTKFSDILNDLYVNDKLTAKDCGIKDTDDASEKGVKLSRIYEGIMLVMNVLCDRIQSTPDYDKIIKMPNYVLQHYRSLIKLPIDLSDHYDYRLNSEDIDLVIKKNYDDKGVYIRNVYNAKLGENNNGVNDAMKLVQHLKGYTLTLKITKDTLKTIMANPDKYNPDGANDIIINLLKKFNLNRLVSGKSFVDGTLTIKLS